MVCTPHSTPVVTSSTRYIIDIEEIPVWVAQPISQVRLFEYPATAPSSLITGMAFRKSCAFKSGLNQADEIPYRQQLTSGVRATFLAHNKAAFFLADYKTFI